MCAKCGRMNGRSAAYKVINLPNAPVPSPSRAGAAARRPPPNFRRRSDGGTETVSALPTKDGEALIATAIANLEVNQTETPTAVPPTETPSPTTAPTPEAVFSETNGRFAFDADLEGSYNIYTVNGDGSGLRQITFHQAKDGDPSWSPDGSEIVFISERDGVRNLYIAGDDGLNLRQLTTNSESDQSPAWSPVSDKIAFVTLGQNSPDIFAVNSDGSGQTNLTNHPANDLNPAWSPDGSKIVFISDRDGRNQLYLMNAEVRLPLFWLIVGELFLDAGNVWRETEQFNAKDIKFTTGFGLVFLTPVGPVRFEYGLKLNPDSADKQPGAFHLGCYYAF